jgi:hypothetical protein
MKKNCIIFWVAMSIGVHAQYFSKYFGAALDVNKPIVNTEFIGATSTRGMKIMYREFINDRLTVGGEATLATFKDYLAPAVYTSSSNPNTSIYTDIYPFVYSYTLTFAGEYFFTTEKGVMPFAGFGLGAAHNQFTMYYNVYQQEDKRWGAIIRPHAGVIVRFGKESNWGLMAAAHLGYATTKSTDTDYNNGFATIGIQLGLVFLKQ